MSVPRFPSLYQINTRVWLTELSANLGRRATLDDVPDHELDRLAAHGLDWIWLLSVWQTGPTAQKISRSREDWRREFQETLPDLHDEDIGGSGFAIAAYCVSEILGGDGALSRLRERLRHRGLRLLLDFVPNHMGPDHPWVETHPDYFIAGTVEELARFPQNYTRVSRAQGDLILAYGRDPYFSGWPDTLQLDYSNPLTREAMADELRRISGQCDGVRCDMAMLIVPEVFGRTWGRRSEAFWPEAIRRVRELTPDFCFIAEVYWDMEWTLQQQGFDYTYDKRLFDRLKEGPAGPLRAHLRAGLDYQRKLVRFMENHDEPRAAASFPQGRHEAAAVITYLVPGLRFFHDGQFQGRRTRVSPHLVRRPPEPTDAGLEKFYGQLQTILRRPIVRDGRWQLLECRPAWEGNWTSDCFVAFTWWGDNDRLLVAVNYSPNESQCYVRLPCSDLAGTNWRLEDLFGTGSYDRNGDDLQGQGLFLDVGPWNAAVFCISRA